MKDRYQYVNCVELLSSNVVQKRIEDLGYDITKDYQGSSLVVVCVLKGSFIFAADLIRHIDCNMQIDFVRLASYGSQMESSGSVTLISDIDINIENKNVLVVEDIIDTGLTINFLKKMLSRRNPKSLKVVCLLNKRARRKFNASPDYIGFEIGDDFVVGYGLDFDGYYRNLSNIVKVKLGGVN